ncbi:hypothetical protein TPEGhana051_0911a [Treponema pallidum subsp. pertenue]|uniref:Secreted protein n=2 Tax=Treponema pallidum TaxID=160 RepID=A0AAU8RYH0_TREPL|nr:hypothetical protein TPESAMD_0911a [Treponema pallidum subsp. pertenue str. SamoaD]AEZ59115.1 hypothetical protein TPECDC2_0911a [Treponema pallidum subsp. pertenue str. CDC2]AEZ60183.1 hypothetical protein TPEGAU_0911a [Treponema pallidum subsp. pertenue str. Gauthier]AGK84566.1 hypothetical protein TPFB_0911a [Treponema pallidum str. Fribourg-Blanc]AJB40943.1 hypothetical protein TENDBA_0911a [Treponema pallidum subsp. endemicum str. Bosnia A]ASV58573.1 hypothetical protein TPEGhana051_09
MDLYLFTRLIFGIGAHGLIPRLMHTSGNITVVCTKRQRLQRQPDRFPVGYTHLSCAQTEHAPEVRLAPRRYQTFLQFQQFFLQWRPCPKRQ